MRLSELALPLRYAVYVAGALLALFVAVGVGAAASLMVGGQSESTQAVQGGSTGSETLEGTTTETTATDDALEGTSIGGTDSEAQETNLERPAEGTTFIHRATDENSRGDYTYLSDPAIEGDPNAVVIVVGSASREGAGGATYGHNIGVWYEPGAQKWAIFNQDLAAVPTGASFRVVLPAASESFVHRARLVNTADNITYLDHPLTNGKPGIVLLVTQNWNPGGGDGVYNDHAVGVLYDEEVQKWAIYNRDGAQIPEGAAFNLTVSESDESAR